MSEFVQKETVEKLVALFAGDPGNPYTLSELIRMAEEKGAALSHLVVAQAMAQEKLGYEDDPRTGRRRLSAQPRRLPARPHHGEEFPLGEGCLGPGPGESRGSGLDRR